MTQCQIQWFHFRFTFFCCFFFFWLWLIVNFMCLLYWSLISLVVKIFFFNYHPTRIWNHQETNKTKQKKNVEIINISWCISRTKKKIYNVIHRIKNCCCCCFVGIQKVFNFYFLSRIDCFWLLLLLFTNDKHQTTGIFFCFYKISGSIWYIVFFCCSRMNSHYDSISSSRHMIRYDPGTQIHTHIITLYDPKKYDWYNYWEWRYVWISLSLKSFWPSFFFSIYLSHISRIITYWSNEKKSRRHNEMMMMIKIVVITNHQSPIHLQAYD